ncbi:hypothetical protein B0H10DRAFT_1958157 [Mycena sp. CBHHK59/15]|nr:hypothetical protein B0H10DRAFT_1958157 [Mycena sp. CBHHK59/15]
MYGLGVPTGLDAVGGAETMMARRGGVRWPGKGIGSAHGAANGLGAMVGSSTGVQDASAVSTGQEVSPAASGGDRAEVDAKLEGAGREKYKSSRKPVLADRLGTTKEDARGGVEAAVSEKDLCQVSGVKGKSESAYDVRDGTCEDGDRSGRGPDSSGE